MNSAIPWTLFWDMHSGGGTKEGNYDRIYIQAPQAEAEVIFYNRFGHSPNRVSCTCCGADYSISESPTLEKASGFHRNCAYAYLDANGVEVPESEAWVRGKGVKDGYTSGYVERRNSSIDKYYRTVEEAKKAKPYLTLDQYRTLKSVLIIPDDEIKPEERTGEVPEQGYVWVG